MAEFADAFDNVTDSDLWVEAAIVFAAFLAPTVARNMLDPFMPGEGLPDAIYGIIVMAAAAFAPDYQESVALGGGLYTVDKVAERFDLKQKAESAVPGGA